MDRRQAVPLVMVVAGLAGVVISIYLTTVHYARVPLVCSSTGLVNCERVLSSSYSSVMGIPWSVGGIVWFAVATAGALLALRRSEPALLQPAQVAWSLIGLATALYLVGVEAVSLGVLCAWCTALHGLVLVALVLSIARTPILPEAASGSDRDRRPPRPATPTRTRA